ncbi:MAG TPA: cation diffusion facilitator family transporter [Candidatus Methanofastidiosa archaeon]|nr:cation diffusion facilitator family transporter [Candidatus Methanofastidiosa archaeon]
MNEGGIESSFRVAIALTLIFFALEILGGIFSNSLSLLSDAGHMFRDAFALLISYSAIRISKRLPSSTRTFGYHRVEIFAALINSLMLFAISIVIVNEAIKRIGSQPEIDTPVMLAVALMGLAINLYIGYKLHGNDDINVKSAYLHVLSDALSSLMIVIGSISIYFTGNRVIDPVISILIVVIIVMSSFGIIRSSLRILLEFTPEGIDMDMLLESLEAIGGVVEVHNVRLWSICSNLNSFDAHFVINDQMLHDAEAIKGRIRQVLSDNGIQYSTIEFECERCKTPDTIGPSLH